MTGIYSDLLKHSAIYGAGQVLTRLASVLLLPVYTRFLSPADYGVIAILDLTVAILGVLLGRATSVTLSRYHFDSEDERERDVLWWTGVTGFLIVAAVLVTPAFLMRDRLARWVLGIADDAAGTLLALALVNLLLTAIEQVFVSHLRVYKRSVLVVAISLGRLLLNIALNLYLLTARDLGVAAILWGNLLTAVAVVAVLAALFIRRRGGYRIDAALLVRLGAYAGPMAVTAWLDLGLHQADRYVLRSYLGLSDVGLYSVAYAIGHGVNTLVLLPFTQIWGVAIFDIRKESNAPAIYARIFRAFVELLALFLFAVSLFSRFLLELLAGPRFQAAASLVPIVCLAYLFFSLNSHFNVPALLTKRTIDLVPASAAALGINIAANLVLVPRFGATGAAWASVLSFFVLAFLGLLIYRRIDKYQYPFRRIGAVVSGLTMSYAGWAWFDAHYASGNLAAVLLWLGWAAVIVPPLWLRGWQELRAPTPGPAES